MDGCEGMLDHNGDEGAPFDFPSESGILGPFPMMESLSSVLRPMRTQSLVRQAESGAGLSSGKRPVRLDMDCEGMVVRSDGGAGGDILRLTKTQTFNFAPIA